MAEPENHAAWPLRALLLGGLGAAIGAIVYQLGLAGQNGRWTDDAARVAAAAFLGIGGIAFAFSLERLRWTWSLAYAAAAGALAALVIAVNGTPEAWGAGEAWQFLAALLAIAVALPLFQAARDSGTIRVAPAGVHGHAWTDLVLWGAGWAFVGASMLLVVLLAELFHLIGIDALRDLIRTGWFPSAIVGGALGAAVGLLRDRDSVLALLHKVVRAILSVLAPVLALGLACFVLALPFTGLAPLWQQTSATTPLLLVCILGAVGLANSVAGNSAEEEARAPVLLWSAGALIAVLLPLAIVAAVSTGKRIGQHGFTPDRLWAAVFVGFAGAVAVGYLIALVRGRGRWPEALRRANVRLAAGLCLLALFLALPIVSFGAISARDQVARLESGRISPDRFDWAAMRFDFGSAGRGALQRLAAAGPEALRERARQALAAESRWAIAEPAAPVRRPRLAVDGGAPLPPRLEEAIAAAHRCTHDEARCRLAFPGEGEAVLFASNCDRCAAELTLFLRRPDGSWSAQHSDDLVPVADGAGATAGLAHGRVEIRPVEKRQVFVDGRPLGPVFDKR